MAILIAVLLFLHYLLWLAEDGVRQTHALRIAIRAQTDENAALAERNSALAAEVADLKNGLMAIEERARSEMGMIRQDETFYRLLEQPLPATSLGPPASKPVAPVRNPAATAKPTAPPTKPAAPSPRRALSPPAGEPLRAPRSVAPRAPENRQ